MKKFKSYAASVLLLTLIMVPIAICIPFAVVVPAADNPTWQTATDLDSLPIDGTPVRVTMFSKRSDAWQRKSGQAFQLFVRRSPVDGHVQAFIAEHHLQLHIPVTYDAKSGVFRSACWKHTFTLSGHCRESNDGADELPQVSARVVDGQVQVRLPPHSASAEEAV